MPRPEKRKSDMSELERDQKEGGGVATINTPPGGLMPRPDMSDHHTHPPPQHTHTFS